MEDTNKSNPSKTGIKKILLFCIVATVMLICMIMVVNKKRNYHIDELYSFTLSNCATWGFAYEEGKTYKPANSIYLEQFGVNDTEAFNYSLVWKNQTEDVHPPLYYAILHTICSLSKGTVNRWQPALINFVFAILTIFMMHRIMTLYIETEENNKGNHIFFDILTLICAILPGFLNNVSFFRMYVMAMFFVTWTSYLFTRMIKEVYNGEKITKKMWPALYLVGLCSALTHYYCVMFLVFSDILFFLYLCAKKRWKDMICQLILSIISACSAILIFPGMLYHVFGSYRGTEAQNSLKNISLETYISQLVKFYDFFNDSMFGGFLSVIFIAMAVGVVILLIREKKHVKSSTEIMLLMMFLPALMYYLLLGKMAAYVSPRYLFPIYAILYLCIVLSVNLIWQQISSNATVRVAALTLLFAACCVNSYRTTKWNYLFLADSLQDNLIKYQDKDALILIDDCTWKLMSMYQEVKDFDRVTIVKRDNLALLKSTDFTKDKEYIVFALEKSDVKKLIKKMNQSNNMEKIGSFSYFKVYRVYNE